jgi:hypothetical protein
MSRHYTEADVQAIVDYFMSWPFDNSEEQDARAILDAVAPAIAARALREGQAEHERKADRATDPTSRTLNLFVADAYRNRADEIEARG